RSAFGMEAATGRPRSFLRPVLPLRERRSLREWRPSIRYANATPTTLEACRCVHPFRHRILKGLTWRPATSPAASAVRTTTRLLGVGGRSVSPEMIYHGRLHRIGTTTGQLSM